jgi:hypothetical protein
LNRGEERHKLARGIFHGKRVNYGNVIGRGRRISLGALGFGIGCSGELTIKDESPYARRTVDSS